MRSSTSNSRDAGKDATKGPSNRTVRAQRRRSAIAAALLCAGTFALCTVGGELLARPGRPLEYAWVNPSPSDLPDGSWFAHYRRGSNVGSHAVLYHAAGPALENARAADVLFLGNSRMGMGMTVEAQRAFARRLDIKTFDMTFGNSEAHCFPLRIIERHDLRPRLTVINADRFFARTLSGPAQRVLRDSRWEELRDSGEERLARRWRMGPGSRLPHFTPRLPVPLEWRAEDVWTIFRSEDDGAWYPWHLPSIDLPVDPATGSDELLPAELEAARSFLDELRARGSTLVLTLVPTRKGDGSLTRARKLADELGVPLIAPRMDGLVTHDGSHLDGRSAAEWSEAFFAALEADALVRSALGLD